MRRTWILCLLIALLPLRGWALSVMAVDRIAQESGQAAAAQLPPCHQAMGPAADGHAPQDDAGHAGGHACSHCAICHGALGPLSLPLLPQRMAAVGETPAWAGHPVPARAPDLPFKPPRA